jgi:hypothetical protein
MQFPLLFLVQWTFLRWQPDFMQFTWIQTLLPVLLTASIVGLALLIYRFTATTSLNWLFTAPRWALYPTSQLHLRRKQRTFDTHALARADGTIARLPPGDRVDSEQLESVD